MSVKKVVRPVPLNKRSSSKGCGQEDSQEGSEVTENRSKTFPKSVLVTKNICEERSEATAALSSNYQQKKGFERCFHCQKNVERKRRKAMLQPLFKVSKEKALVERAKLPDRGKPHLVLLSRDCLVVLAPMFTKAFRNLKSVFAKHAVDNLEACS
jgi:hypothetical protein